jgi:hypothetical protein
LLAEVAQLQARVDVELGEMLAEIEIKSVRFSEFVVDVFLFFDESNMHASI